ncbi:hypothetical protein B0H14DRAFT_2613361 [Mycena olivaceomarginata]|nr:hypothetical protein B0H14DRAFT_2613361 [Mycena olivaceomarginata]
MCGRDLKTSFKLFEGSVCGARVKSLQQGSTRDPDQAVVRGEEREHKIFVTFRESSQKVLEPLAWLGSGWRILDLPLLIFVSAVDPRHSVGMLASRHNLPTLTGFGIPIFTATWHSVCRKAWELSQD